MKPVDSTPSTPIPAGAPDAPGRFKEALLAADLRYRRLQIADERTNLILKGLTIAVGVAVAAGLATMLSGAVQAKGVVVDAFDAPPDLANQGLSGRVVAGAMQDVLTTIQNSVRTTAARRNISNAWTGDITVQVPQTGVSIGEIDRLLRAKLGKETHVGGALVINPDKSLSLTVRGTAIAPKTFTGPAEAFPALATEASEYLYGLYEPRLFATYLNQKGRREEGLAFVAAAYARGPDAVRPELAATWGVMLNGLKRREEAVQKYRLALALDPHFWRGWNSMIGVLPYLGLTGEERAIQAGREMSRVAGAAPRNDQPGPASWVNYMERLQDWSGQVKAFTADAKASGGAGSFSAATNSDMATAAMRLHDWTAADRYLTLADPSDASAEPARRLMEGMQALDAGDPARAAPALEAFMTAWEGDNSFQYRWPEGPCSLGLAYGLTGRRADAERAFARAPFRVACRTGMADTLEAAGDRAGADAAYAQAIAPAPSVPYAYQRLGVALLRRGDLKGALVRFKQAQARGPTWAEPVKGEADVLAAQGRKREADAAYARARKLAPAWTALAAATPR